MFSKIFDVEDNKKRFYSFIILALLVWFIWANPDIALMVFAAVSFACALVPLVDKLSKKMSRTLATTIVLISLIFLICLLTIPIFVLGTYQIVDFVENFPKYIENLDDILMGIPLFKSLNFSLDTSSIASSLASSSSDIIESISEFVKSASSAFLYIFTTIVLIFFMLVDKEKINNGILKLYPPQIRNKISKVADTIFEKLGWYVISQVFVSASVWIIMTIGLMIFHIKYAVILGLIAGILSIIPVLGSFISLIICLIASYESGILALIIVTVMFTISHFVENHVVRPYVYSKFLNLHPILIFLALFIGAKYGGVCGVIFSSPIAMALYIFLDELYIKKINA